MARFRTQQRSFRVGESIYFEVKVTNSKTMEPVDPQSVVMTALRSPNGDTVLPNRAFVRIEQGDYTYLLDTAGLLPEVYEVVITISGADGVVIRKDQFVLEAA